VLDVLPEGVLIVDARLQALMANPAAAELLGRDLVG
jgi:PAS domain-containing protein